MSRKPGLTQELTNLPALTAEGGRRIAMVQIVSGSGPAGHVADVWEFGRPLTNADADEQNAGIRVLGIGASDKLQVGDWYMAARWPFDLSSTVRWYWTIAAGSTLCCVYPTTTPSPTSSPTSPTSSPTSPTASPTPSHSHGPTGTPTETAGEYYCIRADIWNYGIDYACAGSPNSSIYYCDVVNDFTIFGTCFVSGPTETTILNLVSGPWGTVAGGGELQCEENCPPN